MGDVELIDRLQQVTTVDSRHARRQYCAVSPETMCELTNDEPLGRHTTADFPTFADRAIYFACVNFFVFFLF